MSEYSRRYVSEEFENIDKERALRLFIPDAYAHYNRGDLDIFEIDYRKNNFDYRSDEFNNLDNDKKILFLGCSLTYGTGLPEEFRFSNILSNLLDVPMANLGSTGDSIMHQVRKAFWYFRNFGNPKIIVGIFPVFRMDFIRVTKKNEIKEFSHTKTDEQIKDMNYIRDHRTNVGNTYFKKYSKAPHDFAGVIAPELAIYYSYIYLDMLDQYCRSNGIELVWATWESQEYIEDLAPSYFDTYIPCHENKILIKSLSWYPENFDEDRKLFLDCHKDLSEHQLFHLGADRLDKKLPEMFGVHWGIHKNIHIAEELYEHIISRGVYDT